MLAYVIRRLLYTPLLVFGVCLVTFIIFNLVSGDPTVLLAGKHATPSQIRDLRHQLGFDRPAFADVSFLQRRLQGGRIAAAVEAMVPPPEVAGIETLLANADLVLKRIQRPKPGDDAAAIDAALADLAAEARKIGVEPEPAATPKDRLAAITGPTLRWRTELATVTQDARDAVLDYGVLAVHELVDLIGRSADPEVVAGASRALAFAVYADLVVEPTANAEDLASGKQAVASWWAAHSDEYRYEFDFSAFLKSLGRSQFIHYLGEVVTFDFGRSYKNDANVWEMIREGAPISIALTLPAFVIGTILSVVIALFCAFYQGRFVDRIAVITSVAGMSVSILVFIIVGQKVLAADWGLFPIQGHERGLRGAIYYVLPALIWVIAGLGADVRFYRTVFVEETRRDYMRTARAKGLSNRQVMFRHLLKNAMVPIVTHVVIVLPFLYTGSLLLESYFGLPGLGGKTVKAVLGSDFPVIKAMTLLGSLMYIVAVLATDLLYALVDPRVRLE